MSKDVVESNLQLMQAYGSRVIMGGKKVVLPVTDAAAMDGIVFQGAGQDREIRVYIGSARTMDEEWKAWQREKWWGKESREEGIDPRLYELRERLLSFGGEAACLPVTEEDIDEILRYGQAWHGYKALRRKGRVSRCHQNSAGLCLRYGYRLCTGYALSDDGMWRQHSWCIEKRPRTTKIIETTKPRLLYFGYVLCDADFQRFVARLPEI